MSGEKPEERELSLDDLSIDGRPLRRRPGQLNTITLDERDNGLYRDKLHASESTYDPFAASHYEASLARGLSSGHVRRRRLQAWIFLVMPFALAGMFGTLQAWDDFGDGAYLKAIGTAVLWWLPTVYWLYVIYRPRPAR